MAEPNGRVDYLHDELRDLRRYAMERFDALDAKLDALASKLDAKADKTTVSGLESRVAAIERDHVRWSIPRLAGGAFVLAVISALAGALVRDALARMSLGG